ncbi:hypothetical protein MMC21_002857 [Puttea exsequens]|nr:hypothetical protein [Puttea exsequens]
MAEAVEAATIPVTTPQTPLANGNNELKDATMTNGHVPQNLPSAVISEENHDMAPNPTVDASTSPVKTPFIHPTSTSQLPPARTYTADQQTKYATLLNKAQFWTDLPTTSAPNSPKSPITDSERMWLTRECIYRYLRASKWNDAQAATRLQATLVWRREYGVEGFTAEHISPENETGKQLILGYDVAGRPCLYLNPHKQNTKKSERQIHHLVFMLERCIDLLPPGQENLAILINFKDTRKGEGATVKQGIQVTHILQNHYPERLGRACIQDTPWLIWGFFKMINPFIDPLTREKMKFDADLRQVVPPEQLLKKFGGDVEFEYYHEVYWPAVNGLAEQRKKEKVERWERAGKRVGESEFYLRGAGEPVSVEDEKSGKIGDAKEKIAGKVEILAEVKA